MPEIKTYIGCKVIQAYLETENEFRQGAGRPTVAEDRPGYHVIYPDGYESWSPRDVFEGAYREVSSGERSFFA